MACFTTPVGPFSSCELRPAGPEGDSPVVWLRGDHDIANRDLLARTIGDAIALGEPAVVIDLSAVHMVCAAALSVFVAAQETLRKQSRNLVVRAPSPFVRRIFGATGLGDLLDGEPLDLGPLAKADALGSWIEVPTTGRVDGCDASVMLEPPAAEKVCSSAHVEEQMSKRLPQIADVLGEVSSTAAVLNERR